MVMRTARPYDVPGTSIIVVTSVAISPQTSIARLIRPIPYVFSGFFPQEPGIAWAMTRSPVVQIFQCQAHAVRFGVIGFAVWPHKEAAADSLQASLPVTISVNGEYHQTLRFSKGTRQQFLELPVQCVNGRMSVALEYDHLIVPRDVTASNDSRPLGIGIVDRAPRRIAPLTDVCESRS
jgi:hypothetical protein